MYLYILYLHIEFFWGEGMTLADLRPGDTAIVTGLAQTNMKRRLQDLGLIDGTPVTCIGVSPLGDPKAFAVRGTVIAIRATDSRHIAVRSD